MLAALLWDVDGTLAETERDGHRVAFNQAFEALGLPWRWSVERYGRLLRVTGGRERLVAAMAEESGAPATDAGRDALARELHQIKNRCYAQLVHEGAIALRPGVAELIDEARAHGLRQAIVTTTSRVNVEALLARHFGSRWTTLFETAVCGEDVRSKKPDPEAHRLALALLGVQAADALAIEDSGLGASAALVAGVPVLVTRSVYFAADRIEGAVAIGPGLHTRDGWIPSPVSRPVGRTTLEDIARWQAHAATASTGWSDQMHR